MPRRHIYDYPGAVHFVTFSTYQRRRFLDSPETRDIVLEVLQKCLLQHQCECCGFVLMPNHVHAIFHGPENFRISPFIQVWKKTSSYRIQQFFARELTKYRELCPEKCPIWQASFYDFNIDSDKLLHEKLEYMHDNPVEAKLSEYPTAWNWSSARFYELKEAPPN